MILERITIDSHQFQGKIFIIRTVLLRDLKDYIFQSIFFQN